MAKLAILSKVYVKAQNERNHSSVIVYCQMVNLSNFMGFVLSVATRYKETRVESSFSTAPAPSRFSPTN